MKSLFEYISHRDINILRIINNSWKCKFLDIIMPCYDLLRLLYFYVYILHWCLFIDSTTATYAMAIKAMISITISTGIGKILKVSCY